jgi:hypothetical protein
MPHRFDHEAALNAFFRSDQFPGAAERSYTLVVHRLSRRLPPNGYGHKVNYLNISKILRLA